MVEECQLPPGSLANGEPCAVRAQCQSRYCQIGDSGCGTCQALVEPGGACAAPTDCAYGNGEVASCDFKGGAAKGTCAIWKLGKAGATCGQGELCDIGFHCVGATEDATTGKCQPNQDVGGACKANGYCRQGLVCSSERCGEKPKAGEACRQLDDCVDGLACDGTCQQFSYVDAESECDTTHRCARGRCVQPVTQGQNGQNVANGPATCFAPIEDGETCGPEQDAQGRACDFFARCVGGQCRLADPTKCH
jgi:hypothetical protein